MLRMSLVGDWARDSIKKTALWFMVNLEPKILRIARRSKRRHWSKKNRSLPMNLCVRRCPLTRKRVTQCHQSEPKFHSFHLKFDSSIAPAKGSEVVTHCPNDRPLSLSTFHCFGPIRRTCTAMGMQITRSREAQ